MLAVIAAGKLGSSFGVLTDLSFEDLERFAAARPLSADDVLAVASSLAEE